MIPNLKQPPGMYKNPVSNGKKLTYQLVTPPKFNSSPLKKWWLEDDPFPIGLDGHFSWGELFKLREGNGWKKWDDEPNHYIENWLDITKHPFQKKWLALGFQGLGFIMPSSNGKFDALGPGGLGFELGYLEVTIPFIRGSQESKPPGPKPPTKPLADLIRPH